MRCHRPPPLGPERKGNKKDQNGTHTYHVTSFAIIGLGLTELHPSYNNLQ